MKLADVVKPTGRRIARGVEVYEGLSPEDQATFKAVLENPAYTHGDLAKGLQEMGHEITYTQIKEFAQKVRSGGYVL